MKRGFTILPPGAAPLGGFTDRVVYGFTGRGGGVSPPPYASLNLGTNTEDDPENVKKNLEIAASEYGFRAQDLVTVKQVHSNNVHVVERGSEEDTNDSDHSGVTPETLPKTIIEADAIITSLKWVPVGVLTADCLPLLLFDPERNVVAAVHAGWRGIVAKVASRAVEVMEKRFNSRARDVRAVLGPYIGPCCYTVGPEVIDSFVGSYVGDNLEDKNVYGVEDRRSWFDLGRAVRSELLHMGLDWDSIVFEYACTSCDNERLFSYRKDGNKAGGATGRQLGFIMLKG